MDISRPYFIQRLVNGVNVGCAVEAPNGTYNIPFNQAGGGVFVLEWDRERFLRIWNFVKPNIPTDIVNVSSGFRTLSSSTTSFK